MTVPMFLQLTSNRPFRPFTILTNDGREYRIEHPENYWVVPNSPCLGRQDSRREVSPCFLGRSPQIPQKV
jgi:hypothetical protein